ncbi:hypothetical protein CQ12_40785 [Bradyrhizobium jicamae]|uniref:Uncharacterized protein n=1 Tax=Bradyrhizobium jicamae TaxID=280332 RepID=A0A0R3M1I1_9BRAD|nr:hypothetical protein [Bradyrhizobium jicamae]KRR13921.1 hypothetical protein CQ12_40785 [Bradyrhizobium jicamae]
MLHDADGQGGSGPGGKARETVQDADALFNKLKQWVKTDFNSKGQVNWRREAREDYDFELGEHDACRFDPFWQERDCAGSGSIARSSAAILASAR